MRKVLWFFCLFFIDILYFSNVAAIEAAPCCPPGTSAISRAIALKLQEIKSSSGYHMMQLIVFSVVILLILVILGIVWIKKNKK